MIPIHHSCLWFPNQGGLTSGLIIGAFGVGTIIFNEIARLIVNPNNIQAVDGVFPPEVTANVPKMLKTMCWCYVTMMLTSVFFIFPAEEIKITSRDNPIELPQIERSESNLI